MAELAATFATQDLAHWLRVFDGVDGCVSAVATLEEAAVASGALPSADAGPTSLPTPFVLNGGRLWRSGRPPALGEHTEESLVAAGFTADEARELLHAGAVVGAL